MLLKTYEFIKTNLHLLEVDLENGTILNRKETLNNSRGYLYITLEGKAVDVHQVIGVMLFGEDVISKDLNHINGVKTDNRATNLEVVTHKRNIQHAFEIGLTNTALSIDDVKEIKKLIATGETDQSISELFNVTLSTIWNIRNERTWAHVKLHAINDYSKKIKKLNLEEKDIENIHKLYHTGHTQAQIAEFYGCSQTSIGRILNKTRRFASKGDFIVRKKFTTTLDDKLIKALKLKAVNENTDVSKIIEKTLKEMLENERKSN